MKNFLLIILIFALNYIYPQKDKQTFETKEFSKDLSLFIDSVKSSIKGVDSIYIVYFANVYSTKECDFGFTLGYIMNTANLLFLDPNYIYYCKNQIILVRIDPAKYKQLIKQLGFHKLDNKSSKKVKLKLFPSENGGYSDRGPGFTYCSKLENSSAKYYFNHDEIPFEISIYSSLPIGLKANKTESK